MRCFVAIEISGDVRAALSSQTAGWALDQRHMRICRAEHLHLTLKFLGEVPGAQVDAIGAAVAVAARVVEPFALEFEGPGAFPNAQSPRVLWQGVADAVGGCARWLERAEAELVKLGIEAENRPFHPHVTLARARDPSGSAAMRRVLATPPAPLQRSMLVRELTLFESRPGPQGPAYRAIVRCPLGGPLLDASSGSG
jgi:2'-5' RNA ligase